LIDFPTNEYKMPGHNLLLEAGVVGATIVPVYGVVCAVVDSAMGTRTKEAYGSLGNYDWVVKVALTGFVYHNLAELYGMNDWFLRNSVAKRKQEREQTMDMMTRRKERYNYENYAVPQFPDADRRSPLNDKWASGSWTTAQTAPVANAVQQFPVQQ